MKNIKFRYMLAFYNNTTLIYVLCNCICVCVCDNVVSHNLDMKAKYYDLE